MEMNDDVVVVASVVAETLIDVVNVVPSFSVTNHVTFVATNPKSYYNHEPDFQFHLMLLML